VESAVNRLASEKFYIAGKSWFWRLIGIGLLGLGLGSAVGVGFYGYSYISRNNEGIRHLSTALAKGLSDVQLKAVAEGTVSLTPSELNLAKDQTVTLDPMSRVRLEPNASVKADGELRVYAPSISPQPSERSAKNTPAAVTDFTIFKQVAFEKGTVMTGWRFLTSAQKTPSSQYCYYTESSENSGLDIVVSIARDMKLEAPKTIPKNFDLASAFDRCVWFRTAGSMPRPAHIRPGGSDASSWNAAVRGK
jgi:hypothetical protein